MSIGRANGAAPHSQYLAAPCVFYIVSQKPGMQYYASQLSQMWIDFNNSFTVAFLDEPQINRE